MNHYIPTYEECIKIVNSNPDMYFYEKRFTINSYNVSTFGYRHARYNNFIFPVLEDINIKALELKGITYVFDDNGEYEHYLLLPKFWELNQYNHCNYNLVKDKTIKNVTVKEDGTLVSFLYLPDKKIISFAKHGIGGNINVSANKFLENKVYYNFIKKCLDSDIQPIFEHIDDTKIVKYDKNDLILIKLRDRKTGIFLNIKDLNTDGITIVNEVSCNLDDLIKESDNYNNGVEGWIVQFTDDTFIKVKSKWWVDKKIELNEKVF